jgi:hypothetical protein
MLHFFRTWTPLPLSMVCFATWFRHEIYQIPIYNTFIRAGYQIPIQNTFRRAGYRSNIEHIRKRRLPHSNTEHDQMCRLPNSNVEQAPVTKSLRTTTHMNSFRHTLYAWREWDTNMDNNRSGTWNSWQPIRVTWTQPRVCVCVCVCVCARVRARAGAGVRACVWYYTCLIPEIVLRHKIKCSTDVTFKFPYTRQLTRNRYSI